MSVRPSMETHRDWLIWPRMNFDFPGKQNIITNDLTMNVCWAFLENNTFPSWSDCGCQWTLQVDLTMNVNTLFLVDLTMDVFKCLSFLHLYEACITDSKYFTKDVFLYHIGGNLTGPQRQSPYTLWRTLLLYPTWSPLIHSDVGYLKSLNPLGCRLHEAP